MSILLSLITVLQRGFDILHERHGKKEVSQNLAINKHFFVSESESKTDTF